MSTVRVYYDNADTDWQLIYFQGINHDYSNQLFPEVTTDIVHPYYPRRTSDFNSDGYVDISLADSNKVSFYIKRKDGAYFYNGELCGVSNETDGPTCSYCWETGYVWTIDLTYNTELTYYIKQLDPKVYRDSLHTEPAIFGITVGDEYDDNTDIVNNSFYIHYNLKDYITVSNPDDNTFNSIDPMIYLLGKSYDIGELDMQLSLSDEALQAQKDDAITMIEENIANCLYKLGLAPADFDEVSFQADVAGFKEGKDASLESIIDFLDDCLNRKAAIS